MRPQQYEPPEDEPEAAAEPAGMDAARAARDAATDLLPLPLPQEYDDEPEYQPAPVHPLHRYAAAARPRIRRRPSRTITTRSLSNMPTSRSRIRRATTMRCMDGSRPASTTISAIRPIRTIPTPTRARNSAEPALKKRRSGMMTVAAVLALAVVGTGAAFGYRTFAVRRARRAADHQGGQQPDQGGAGAVRAAAKTPDRMLSGDGGEKLVSREETPIDVNARSAAPRVVIPPLNQNANPPPVASVSPSAPMPAATGTMPNNEPRKIKTLAVKGDAADNGGIPAGASAAAAEAGDAKRCCPGAAARGAYPASANASANAPMSHRAAGRCRGAADPDGGDQSGADRLQRRRGGGYLVQVSSQKNEADAQASYRDAAGQVPAVLGSHPTMISGSISAKRASITAPWSARSVVRGGGAALRQPEKCRRTVLRPEELTAVSLTLGRARANRPL